MLPLNGIKWVFSESILHQITDSYVVTLEFDLNSLGSYIVATSIIFYTMPFTYDGKYTRLQGSL